VGHVKIACRKLKKAAIKTVQGKQLGEVSDSDNEDCLNVRDEYCWVVKTREDTLSVQEATCLKGVGKVLAVGSNPKQPILLGVQINGVMCQLEMDTGSVHTLINSGDFDSLFGNECKNRPVIDCDKRPKLSDYNGCSIPVLGQGTVCVSFNGQERKLLITVAAKGSSVIGRDWLWYLKPELFKTNVDSGNVEPCFAVKKIGEFSGVMGNGSSADLTLVDCKPVFCKDQIVGYYGGFVTSDLVQPLVYKRAGKVVCTLFPGREFSCNLKI